MQAAPPEVETSTETSHYFFGPRATLHSPAALANLLGLLRGQDVQLREVDQVRVRELVHVHVLEELVEAVPLVRMPGAARILI